MEHTNFFSQLYYALVGDHVHEKTPKFSYWKHLLIAAGLFIGVSIAFVSYRWYVAHRERAAQKIFAECLDQHERAESGDGAVSWAMVVDMWKLGYQQHQSSYLAPYFLAYAAQACEKGGNMQEALNLFQSVCDTLPKKSPLYGTYAIKLALMYGTIKGDKQGMLERLHNLAQDSTNKQQDQALYYLGLYYWSENDLNNATNIWQQLIELCQGESSSGWAQLIEDKYQQLIDSGYPRQDEELFSGALAEPESIVQ